MLIILVPIYILVLGPFYVLKFVIGTIPAAYIFCDFSATGVINVVYFGLWFLCQLITVFLWIFFDCTFPLFVRRLDMQDNFDDWCEKLRPSGNTTGRQYYCHSLLWESTDSIPIGQKELAILESGSTFRCQFCRISIGTCTARSSQSDSGIRLEEWELVDNLCRYVWVAASINWLKNTNF